ncbi:substrate-binding periplasmic protein [Dongia sp.]|uniref:substrate-binding periplasmic protein n=1 Tax=Dongia sp. TaxID=1977262 RepID=UPI0035AF478E
MRSFGGTASISMSFEGRQSRSLRRAGIGALLALLAIFVHSPQPVAAETPIHLVFAETAAPLAFGEDGQVRGIEVDVAREVFTKRLGLAIDTQLYPWERAQQMVRNGEADGFISIPTPERDSYASCGQVPVVRMPMRATMRRNHPQREDVANLRTLDDLRPFALVSYLGNGWARQKLAGFNVTDAADFPASLRGLALGRGDIALVAALSAQYYVNKLQLRGKLVILPNDFDTVEYVLCLGDKSPHAAKLAEFDRVLQVMRADGGYVRILKSYGLEADSAY